MDRKLALLAALFIFVGARGLWAQETRYNWWPLFFYARSPEVKRLEIFGPFIGSY